MQDLIGRTLGHYRIVEKIGAGGMGEVYRATDERLDRDVAVKVLHQAVAQDADRLVRFEREANAVAKLAHPNVLEIWDFGTEDGVTYAVTELLEGQNLRARIPTSGLPWQNVVEIGAAIADGLAAAHGKGIVHRDLKPENVFVTSDGRVKVLDFGLARVLEEVLPEAETATMTPAGTVAGTVMGTMGYMSPEQLRGEPSDARSDIFALGCVLYEMLSGQPAFLRNSTAETTAAILKEEPPSLSDSGTTLPAELERTFRRCLEKNPDARYQSSADLAFALRSISTDQVIRPATSLEELPLGKRRRAAWIVAAAAIVVVAVVAFLFQRQRPVEEPTEVTLPRIVVLPFENLGSPDDEYFADGITEEITSRLAAVSGLQVISRTSAMHYKGRSLPLKQIGEELDVGYVLEGTIRWDRSGGGYGRVRITPQLIRVEDDSHLWTDRYDRVLEDIFAVQSEIGEQVIANLHVAILEPERYRLEALLTDNTEAYQAYLLGLYLFFEKPDMWKSLEMFQLAVDLDPDFAVAYARLGHNHSALYHYRLDFTPERLESAKAAADRSLELQPGLSEGHQALGRYYYQGFRDYEKALEQFSMAVDHQPGNIGAISGIFAVTRRMGRWDEALEALEDWRLVDPQNYLLAIESALTYRWFREFNRAESELLRAMTIEPDKNLSYYSRCELYLAWEGTTDRARASLERAPQPGHQHFERLQIELDLYDRRPQSALARLQDSQFDSFGNQELAMPRTLLECMCRAEIGDRTRARVACSSAEETLRKGIDERPHDHRLYLALGQALALLGRNEEAVIVGERGAEIMPISTDAMDGSYQAIGLAKIYCRVGETDKALDLIEELLSIPCDFSVGLLRLDPVWDPLRDHPRFQALLEEYVTAE